MNKSWLIIVTTLLACTNGSTEWGEGADDRSFNAMLKSGFHDRGIATVARLAQDATQKLCSDPDSLSNPAKAKERAQIEADNWASIKWPSDGQYLGDWREGEKIAQSGRGLTWGDKADQPNGGNCYNCHQISPTEIAYGTIGPSLLRYGKNRDITPDTLKATWAKIYNAKASNACSAMPRGGQMGILGERQIKDLMALLLAPDSPVNQ